MYETWKQLVLIKEMEYDQPTDAMYKALVPGGPRSSIAVDLDYKPFIWTADGKGNFKMYKCITR